MQFIFFKSIFLVLIILTSNTIALAQPTNNDCSNAQVIVPGSTCSNVNGTFAGANINTTAPSCGNSSIQDVWYQFTATTETNFIQLSAVSGLNHGFQIFESSCNGTSIHCINSNGVSTNESGLFNNFVVGTTYFVRVFNASGSLSTANFNICIQAHPTPLNNSCANAQVIVPGSTCSNVNGTFAGANINTTAPSCGNSSIQDVWYQFTATTETNFIQLSAVSGLNHGFQIFEGSCNGTSIHCINSNGVSTNESGLFNNFVVGTTYYVRVFNASGSLSTANFNICIQAHPTPLNNSCANAQVIVPGSTCSNVNGTFAGANINTTAPSCGNSSIQDVWYQFTATTETNFIQLSAVSGLNHGFQIFESSCNGTSIHCINSNGVSTNESGLFNNFVVGTTYYVRVFNASGSLSTANFNICIQAHPTPLNNSCANAQVIVPNTTCINVPSSFAGTSISGPAPTCGINSSQDIWFQFVATETNMSVTLSAVSGLNHGFQIFDNCSGNTLACINNNGVSTSESGSYNQFVVGNTYYIRVFNAVSNLSTANFNICLIGAAPVTCTPTISISSNIGNNICSGDEVTFTANITNGGSSPNYQWQVNGVNVGTNNNSFTSSSLASGSQVTCILTSNASCANPSQVASNSITISVNSINEPTFNQIDPFCQGDVIPSLPTVSLNGITGVWSPTINNQQTTTYTFVPNTGQCAVSTTMTVVINSNTTPTFTQIGPFCQGDVIPALPTVSLNGITGVWSPTINNQQTTTYTFVPNPGQCAVSTTMTVVINSNTTPTFNQIGPFCQGDVIPALPTVSLNGITGVWSPTINNQQTTTYTFVPNTGQCAVSTTMTVVIEQNPSLTISMNGFQLEATTGFNSYVWTFNGNPISGATNNTINVTENGIYQVTVTNSSGCIGSAEFNYQSANLEELNWTNSIFIYPNPSSEISFISFALNQSKTISIQIFDNQGKLLSSQSKLFESGNHVFPIRTDVYSSGLYSIVLSDGSRILNTKIIVN